MTLLPTERDQPKTTPPPLLLLLPDGPHLEATEKAAAVVEHRAEHGAGPVEMGRGGEEQVKGRARRPAAAREKPPAVVGERVGLGQTAWVE